jgi:hypothetical protein
VITIRRSTISLSLFAVLLVLSACGGGGTSAPITPAGPAPGANTLISTKASLATTGTSVTVPSGIFHSGEAYVITIFANEEFVRGVSTKAATAPMLSGLITP